MDAGKLAEYDDRLNAYLRLSSFPVAVRFLRSWDEVPPRARRPLKDLNNRFTTCQAVSFARRFGWVIALGREDSSCVLGAMALGLEKRLASLPGRQPVHRSLHREPRRRPPQRGKRAQAARGCLCRRRYGAA